MKGGGSDKPAIVAGVPAKSELYRLVTTTDEDDRMPKKADPLPREKIETIRKWIEQGARFDGDNPATPLASLVPQMREPDAPKIYSRPVPITALAFSPDGKQLAASGYHEVTLWEPTGGKLLGRIGGLAERAWCIAYSPDGKLMAVAGGTPGRGGAVCLYDVGGSTAPRALERIADMMLVVRFSPDGKTLAAGGADNAIHIYNVQSGKREQLIEQHADWVTDLAFSPDGSKLASASRDKTSRIFDAETGSMATAYFGHTEGLLCVAWSADGTQVFTGGQDRAIHCWRAFDAKPVGKIDGLNGDVYKLEVASDYLLCCCSDGSVREYSLQSRKLIRTLREHGDWAYSMSVDPENRYIAVGGYEGEIRIWDLASGRLDGHFLAAPGQEHR